MQPSTLLVVLFLATLGSCTSNPTASHERTDITRTDTIVSGNIVSSLQGKWQLVSDPNQVVEINDTLITDYTKGEKQLTRTFAYVADCSQAGCIGEKSPYGCFTTAGQFDVDCRTIVALSATRLAITLGGSTGEIAHYMKQQ